MLLLTKGKKSVMNRRRNIGAERCKRNGDMIRKSFMGTRFWLLTSMLAGSIGLGTSYAQSSQGGDAPAPVTNKDSAKQTMADQAAAPADKAARPVEKPAVPAKKPAVAATSPYHPSRFPKRAGLQYALVWGVDSLSVKWAESGEMIRFSYRVLDADKAKALNDKNAVPSLVDWRAGAGLVVPSMEKVGQLRQSEDPVAGKSYWMAFSNKGRLVKRGDHVDVVIGQFRANDLVVD
jgi:hypothetical protein